MKDWDINQSPYPGLIKFSYAWRKVYFGRTKQIDSACKILGDRDTKFLIIAGASGTGKSSLMFAGVLPKLLNNASAIEAEQQIVRIRPADDNSLFRNLSVQLKIRMSMDDLSIPEISEMWLHKQDLMLEKVASIEPTIRAILIDQAEELLESIYDSERASFLDLLNRFNAKNSVSTPIILSVRDDYLGRLSEVKILGQAIDDQKIIYLSALRREQVIEMVQGPAVFANLDVTEVLDTILEQVDGSDTPIMLPMIAETLLELHKRCDNGKLTRAALIGMGGVGGVIATIGEKAFKRCEEILGTEEETVRIFRLVFGALFRYDAYDKSPVRRTANFGDPGSIEENVSSFISICSHEDYRLLSISSFNNDGDGSQLCVEITHEVMLKSWPRLKSLVEEKKNDHLELEHARISAQHWNERGRPASMIHSQRIFEAQNALKSLERDKNWLDCDATKEFVFPKGTLVERLKDSVTKVGFDERARIGDLLNYADRGWFGIGDSRTGLRSFLVDQKPADYWCQVGSFYLGRYPITQDQYRDFSGNENIYRRKRYWPEKYDPIQPSRYDIAKGNQPVTMCSWLEASAFCRWLTEYLQSESCILSHWEVRLPTSSEWAAGLLCENNTWDSVASIPANTISSNLERTVAAGLFPNHKSVHGIEDMIGNVWEYCYEKNSSGSTEWDKSEESRSVMGGSWFETPTLGPTNLTNRSGPNGRSTSVGFRLCLSERDTKI